MMLYTVGYHPVGIIVMKHTMYNRTLNSYYNTDMPAHFYTPNVQHDDTEFTYKLRILIIEQSDWSIKQCGYIKYNYMMMLMHVNDVNA